MVVSPRVQSLALSLLRHGGPDADERHALADELGDPAVQDSLHEFSQKHGVLGATLTAVESLALQRPERARDLARLLSPLAILRRQAALWDLERDRVIRLLAGAGVRPVILKGAALRLTTYQKPAERTLGDLDLLIDQDELSPATAALQRAGYAYLSEELEQRYRDEHFHSRLHSAAGFHVEVHWALTPPGRTVQLSAQAVRRRAIEFPTGAGSIRVPTSEDMLLHLAVQLLEDSYTTLRRIVDIDRIVRANAEFDWGYLIESAKAAHAEVVLAIGLKLAEAHLATPIPPDVVDRLQVSRLTRVHVAAIDPARMMFSQYPRTRAAAGVYLRAWSNSRISDVLTDLEASLGRPFRPPPAPFRPEEIEVSRGWFVSRVAKAAGFWAWLWLRRGPATIRDTMRGRGFWARPVAARGGPPA